MIGDQKTGEATPGQASRPNRVLGLGLLALSLAACDQPAANTQKAKGPPAPPPAVVTVSQPLVRETVEWDEYTARFEAAESVDVRARVSGYLTGVAFKDGQNVKKGDLLYEIDPRPFERALEQARAELAQAKTKSENAMLDVERGRPLVERKILSDKAFDDRANILRDAQAAIKVSEARVGLAELDLGFTRIMSPIDGRISRAMVTAGNFVSAGAAANATVLTTIVSQDPIFIYFDVSENNFLKYKRLAQRGEKAGASEPGSIVEIAMPDDKDFPHKGTLDFVDNRLDLGTATLRARARVENPKLFFSPGMFARVRISGSARFPAVMVPDTAVGTDQASKFVLVVGADNTVARRPVQLGPVQDNLRIVRSGITKDDWVIVNGVQRARPGAKVEPKREQLAAAGGGAAGAAAAPAQPAVAAGAQSAPTGTPAPARATPAPAAAPPADPSAPPKK